MRHISWLAAALVWVGAAGAAAAVGGSVADQAVRLTYAPTHWGATASAELTGADRSGVSQLSASGWWYRVGGDTREFPLPVPDNEAGGYLDNDRIAQNWDDVDGKGFQLQETTWPLDTEGPSGGFLTKLAVHNRIAAPLQITLIHYVNLNLGADGAGDSGTRVKPHFLKFSDGATTASYRASGASHFRIARFDTLLNTLNDAAVTELDDSGAPSGPADLAAAYEFGPFTIASGVTKEDIWVSFQVNPATDHVKGDSLGVLLAPPLHGQTSDLRARAFVPMRRTELLRGSPGPAAPTATSSVAGIDDFDGDLVDEAAFRDIASGAAFVGVNPIVGAPVLPLNWKLSATGDFNHDGKADILWRNTTSQKLVVWTMNGAQKTGSIVPNPDQAANANWEVAGAADFNGDGNRDLLWYNQTTGKVVLWSMNAALVRTAGQFTTPNGVGSNQWRVVAVGDYGKGPGGVHNTQDIVWQNDVSHKTVVWHMDRAATRTSGEFTTPDNFFGTFQVVGPR